MFLYVLVEDIKNRLKLFNNTHGFEPNISEKPFSVLMHISIAQVTNHLRQPKLCDSGLTCISPCHRSLIMCVSKTVVVVLRSPIHSNELSEYNGMLYRTSNRVLNNGIKVIILICMDGTSQYHHHLQNCLIKPGGLLSSKSYMDVPAECRKCDFLCTIFLSNFPPTSIPFLKEKHPILTKLGAFCNNLPKIHPIYLIWAP